MDVPNVSRPYTVCLVVPDALMLEKYAREHGLPNKFGALVANPDVQAMITGEILKALEGRYAHCEIPKKFLYLPEPFTSDNGMMTQTMKLKRRVVLEKLKDRIEALYV